MKLIKFLIYTFIYLSCSSYAVELKNNDYNEYVHVSPSIIKNISVDHQLANLRFNFKIKNAHIYVDTIKLHISNNELNSIAIKSTTTSTINKRKVYEVSGYVSQDIGSIKPELIAKLSFNACTNDGICLSPEIYTYKVNIAQASVTLLDKSFGILKAPKKVKNTNYHNKKLYYLDYLLFLATGILLTFTPCCFPMIPTISGILMSKVRPNPSFIERIINPIAYVIGIIISYSSIGLVAQLTGKSLSIYLINPYSMLFSSLLIFALAISMFDGYNLRFSLLHNISPKLDDSNCSSIIRSVILGISSVFILSPCVAPALATALIVISQCAYTYQAVIAMALMGLGVGTPLLLFVSILNTATPKSGRWLQEIKYFIGFCLIFISLRILGNVIGIPIVKHMLNIIPVVWAAVYIIKGEKESPIKFIPDAIAVFALMASLSYMQSSYLNTSTSRPSLKHGIEAIVTNKASKVMDEIKTSNKPVLVLVSADWCNECHKLKSNSLNNQELSSYIKQHYDFVNLDVTKYSAENSLFLKDNLVFGIPALMIFDSEHSTRSIHKIDGYHTAKQILLELNSLN